MESLQLILAFGFWIAVPVSGWWILAALTPAIEATSRLGAVGLSSAVGIALWSPVLLLLVITRAYSPELVGLIGWVLIVGAAAWRLGFPRRHGRMPSPSGVLAAWDLVFVGGLVVAAILYLAFPGEFVIGGRDENSYTLHALWIAEHRRLDIPYPWPTELHSTFYDAFLRWSGTFRTEPTMTPAFGHVLPVWMAQAMATFGFEGMLRLNGVFSVISVVTVYGLCLWVMNKPIAVATALILALNPAQLWIARTPLTEVLTQLLLWAGIWLVMISLRRRTPAAARLGGYMLGAAVLVRIDMLLVVPLIILAHLATSLLEDESASSGRTWSALYSTGVPSVLLASGYYVVFSRPYFIELLPQLAQIAALSAVAAILLVIGTRPSVHARVAPIVTSRPFVVAMGLGLVALFIYAWWIRPIDEPFRLFGESQVGLAGKRTFAEESLRDLAAYISIPVVVAGVAGWFAITWTSLRSRLGWWMPMLLIVGGFSVIYLWSPSVTPDHFWAIRRFVPAVIPGFILFAGLGMWLALRHRRPQWSAVAGVAALTLFGAFSYQAFQPFLWVSDHNGYRPQLAALASQLPEDELVLALNGERWWKPLYVDFGRRVINVSLVSAEGVSTMRSWLANELEAGREPTVIGLGHELPLSGLRYERVHTATLTRRFHDGSRRPLPHQMATDSADISIFRILGDDPSYGYRDIDLQFGLRWHVDRTGFHEPESREGVGVAWTDGHGVISLPLHGDPPAALSLSVPASAVPGAELRVMVNGIELFRGPVPAEGVRTVLPLDGVPVQPELVIELLSDSRRETHSVPIDGSLYRRDTIERSVGVAVESLKLIGSRSAEVRPIGQVTAGTGQPAGE